MKQPVRMFAGPCPFCKKNTLILYSDNTWDCDNRTVAYNSTTGEVGNRVKCLANGTWRNVADKIALVIKK